MTQRMGKNSRHAPQRDLGSARASRAGDGALAIANFVASVVLLAREVGFGEGAETGTRGACAPQNLRWQNAPRFDHAK